MIQQVNPYEAGSDELLTQITDTESNDIALLRKASILFAIISIGFGVYTTFLFFYVQGNRDAFQKGLYRELARPFVVELLAFVLPSLLSILSFMHATREAQKIAKGILLLAYVIFITTIILAAWQGISA